MNPIDIGLFIWVAPILLGLWGVIYFLSTFVEHPIREILIHADDSEVYKILKEVINREGLAKLEENEDMKRIKIKGRIKFINWILYRCWSKELIFQVDKTNCKTKLLVKATISGWFTVSSKDSNYFSQERLDRLLAEVFAAAKSGN